MKKVFFALSLLISLSILGIFFFRDIFSFPKLKEPKLIVPSTSPRQDKLDISLLSNSQVIEINNDNKILEIYIVEILKKLSLKLIPNFINNKSAERLAREYGCDFAINGGFYKEDGSPLGLFINEGSESGKLIDSSLVNAFFWQKKNGERFISREPPLKFSDIDFILQTGPFITIESKKLKLVEDEPARRSLLGLDKKNRLFMISVTEKDNDFGGPFLSDLPVIFSDPKVQEKIEFKTLLNLDGGSASFFYIKEGNNEFILFELVSVGSVICIQEG